MIKKTTSALLLVATFNSMAQDAEPELKYRRSSLCMIMVESASLPNSEKVAAAYAKHPFPDKYNEHGVGLESFDPTVYAITDDDRIAAGGKKSSAIGNAFAQAGAESLKSATGDIVDIDTLAKDVPLQIQKFIEEKQIAKHIVGRWFNRTEDGKFDYNLIKERGLYSASEEDKELANTTASAEDYLFDKELIGNTFVVFNRLKFNPNEPAARLIRDQALEVANKITVELARQGAVKAAEALYEKTKEGYTVFTKTWLYQLDWNDTIAQKFDSYFLSGNTDPIATWDSTNLFKLKLIGDEVSSSIVTFSFKEKRSEDQIIELSVNRNVDAVLAKLQKKYVVFRPVTPIASVGPVTARIGLKEGLEPGQTFEILESTRDAKTGRFSYSSVGSVQVDKKFPVWDNRYKEPVDIEALVEAALAGEEQVINEEIEPTPEYTTFKGGKKAIQGMHFLRLKK
jgi:hypothetical protein